MGNFIKDSVLEAIKALTKKSNSYNKQSLGMHGAKYIIGAGANPGNWYALQGVNSAVLDVSASTFVSADGTMEGFSGTTDIAIPNGAIIYIRATDIQLASGNAIAYKNRI